MRSILLIAMREYRENAETRGFWFGICLLPALLGIGIPVQKFLAERGRPTRHFILVDRSGMFADAISESLRRNHSQEILQALNQYAARWSRPEALRRTAETTDPEKIRLGTLSPRQLLDQFTDINPQTLDLFATRGGQDFFLEQLKPWLREDIPKFKEPRRAFAIVEPPVETPDDADAREIARRLKPWMTGDAKLELEGGESDLFAVVIIPADAAEQIVRDGGLDPTGASLPRGVEFWSTNLADTRLHDLIREAINSEVRRREFLSRGIHEGVVRAVQRAFVPFRSLDPRKPEGEEEISLADIIRQWAPAGFVYLLWVSVYTVAAMLLNNTIEEKSNRIIEVLLSSVTAWELMMGKLVGIAGIGITIITTWILSLIGVLLWQAGPEAQWALQTFAVLRTSGLLPAFVVYFLLGYLMYAGIFLSIGSMCSTLKDAQNFLGPMMMIMIVPLFTLVFIPQEPNGTLARVLSWIPIYSPFIMMNRAAADPPMTDVVGTLVLMLAFTALTLWLSGRVFRRAILRSGQPPRLIELLRWLFGRAR